VSSSGGKFAGGKNLSKVFTKKSLKSFHEKNLSKFFFDFTWSIIQAILALGFSIRHFLKF